ncbi:MAG: sensor histidine kinase [Candidatus Omnitrophota bacterium]
MIDNSESWFKRLKDEAILFKDYYFERMEKKAFGADYEIRSLTVFELCGQHFLCFGDKRGRLQVHLPESRKEILNIVCFGSIDILSHVNLPNDQLLLFVGIRYKGVKVYRFEVKDGEIEYEDLHWIFEDSKFLRFFYPNIVFTGDGQCVRFEVWTCFFDGDFRIYSSQYPVAYWMEEPGKRLQLPYVINDWAIDRNEYTGHWNMFLGSSSGNIFCISFPKLGAIDFPKDIASLEKEKIITINGAIIEYMIPLSRYKRYGSKEVFYKDYSGCLVKSTNKVICVYFEKYQDFKERHQDIEGKSQDLESKKKQVRTLTKVFPHQLLALTCLPFDDHCCTVVTDIDQKLHLVRNITDMDPEGKSIEVIFDGEIHALSFQDRALRIVSVPDIGNEPDKNHLRYLAFLGMGNHNVLPVNIYDYEKKLTEFREFFHSKIDIPLHSSALAINREDKKKVLNTVEMVLDQFRSKPSSTAVKQLVLQLITQFSKIFCENNDTFLKDHRIEFSRIFYKIIENETLELVIKASDFLTRIEQYCKVSPEVITDLQVHAKKFILAKKSYSNKPEKIYELIGYNEKSGNTTDALTYSGILYDRKYDPVSCIEFEKEYGEITQLAPLNHNTPHKLIVCTSTGSVFCVEFNEEGEAKHPKKTLIYKYKPESSFFDNTRINNIYIGKEKIYLLPRDNVIVALDALALHHCSEDNSFPDNKVTKIPIDSTEGMRFGTAVCRMPQHQEQEDEYLIGTNHGEIFHVLSGKAHDLHLNLPNPSSILDIRSFRWNSRLFIAAAFWNGSIKIFEYFPERKDNKIELKASIQVDTYAVNRMFVFFEKDANYIKWPLILAGTDSGRCYGIRMRMDEFNEGGQIHLSFEWSYRCKEAIKGIHPFSLKEEWKYFLISSLDGYIHILERNGISIGVIPFKYPLSNIYFPAVNLSIENKKDFLNGFVTTSANTLKYIRFFIKEKIMTKIDRCFRGEQDVFEAFKRQDNEILLLKFKSIDLNENFFRTRYYLKSTDFNSAERILEELELILDSGESEDKNYAIKALVNRLFTQYFEDLLQNSELNKKAMELFFKTRIQWGHEGSKSNTKAQLYWMRYMLKGCKVSENPVETFNRWFQKNSETERQYNVRDAGSNDLLRSFIIHPILFLRVKTLQYIHRFITDPEAGKEGQKSKWNSNLVNSLVNAIIEVLNRHPVKTDDVLPWFDLEAVRLLIWMVANYKTTQLCPAKLCYELWKNDISPSFFNRLADAVFFHPMDSKEIKGIETMFRKAGQLVTEFKSGNPHINDIPLSLITCCKQFCENHTRAQEKESEYRCTKVFGGEFSTFFQTVSILLKFKTIKNFSDTSEFTKIVNKKNQEYFKSGPVLDLFIKLCENIKKYYHEKHNDIVMDTFNQLKYSTFFEIKNTIRQIQKGISALKAKNESLWIEIELCSFLLKQWNNIITEEMDNNVILDFAQAIKTYNEQFINENKLMDMPIIFRNIFTRLNIMAECDESYLLYLTKDNQTEKEEVVILRNDGQKEEFLQIPDAIECGIPKDWFKPITFSSLLEDSIARPFQSRKMIPMVIKAPGSDTSDTRAVYLFSWNKDDSDGIVRLEGRGILGEFLATTAYLQSALQEQKTSQEEFFRIVSHELNQIIRGMLAWISNLQTGYFENKPERRKEYYDRFQHSLILADHVIRSILSFRGGTRFDLKYCSLDITIEKIVKLARAQFKDYGNIQLNYIPKPMDYEIITDPELVGISVMNLLTNARKYNPERKPVELQLFTEGSKIVIEVKDQGIGIPREEYNIVFKKFERGAYAKTHRIDGLGIGLAASKNNIEKLGGNILFTSRQGNDSGSAFRITLSTKTFSKALNMSNQVQVKSAPDFNAIEDIALKHKVEKKISYDSFGNMLTLRGALTEEQYQALTRCYENDGMTDAESLNALSELCYEVNKKISEEAMRILKEMEGQSDDE